MAPAPRQVEPLNGGASEPVPTPTSRRVRNRCPYCRTSLRLVGEEFANKKEEVFTCITCNTSLVYETADSADDCYFFETLANDVDDEQPPNQDRGDFDCDEGVIAIFEDLLQEPRDLRKGEAIIVETKDSKGGKVVRPGWLLDDPEVLQNGTSRSEAIYRYAVVFNVAQNKNLEPRYFPPLSTVPKGRAIRIKAAERENMARVQRRNAPNLNVAQRKANLFNFRDYHRAKETQR